MTNTQRRNLERTLRKSPQLSDRRIAKIVRVTHPTVKAARIRLGLKTQIAIRTGLDGKTRVYGRPRKEPEAFPVNFAATVKSVNENAAILARNLDRLHRMGAGARNLQQDARQQTAAALVKLQAALKQFTP